MQLRELSPEGVRAVAGAAHTMGMAGVILDFTGFGQDETAFSVDSTPLALESARTSGRVVAESMLAGLPEAVILAAVPAPEHASPHLIGTLLGLWDGVGPASSSQLHLVIPADCTPEQVRAHAATYRRILRARLAPDLMSDRPSFYAVDMSLGLDRHDAEARTPAESDLKTRLAAALLYANSYVLVAAEAIPASTESFLEPLNGLIRAGVTEAAGARAEVLRGENGAALAFLSGMPNALTLEARRLPIRVALLDTGEVQSVPPSEGPIAVGPFKNPVLIEPLPVNTWVVPSGLWLEAEDVPRGPVQSIPVRFGWANRTELRFTGTLESVTPKEYSLLPPTQAVDLGPGEEIAVAGNLRGRARRGSSIEVRLVLTSPGGAPVTRAFPVAVPPELLWETPAGWPSLSSAVLMDLDGDPSVEVVAVAPGSLVALDGSGRTLWQFPLTGFGNAAFAGLQNWTGKPVVAVATSDCLRMVSGRGLPLWKTSLTGDVRVVRAGNLDASPGDEIVVGGGDGVIGARLANGLELWTVSASGPIVDLELEDVDDEGLDEILVLANGLAAFDHDGQELWTALGDAGPARCPMLIADLRGDWKWTVVVGFDNGSIAVVDATSGDVVKSDTVPSGPIIGLACSELSDEPGQEILVATEERLYCLTSGLTIVWERPIDMSAAATVTGPGADAQVLAPTQSGDLVCLSAMGHERWRDQRAGGAILTPLLATSSTSDDEIHCIYGSDDGSIRAIRLPK